MKLTATQKRTLETLRFDGNYNVSHFRPMYTKYSAQVVESLAKLGLVETVKSCIQGQRIRITSLGIEVSKDNT